MKRQSLFNLIKVSGFLAFVLLVTFIIISKMTLSNPNDTKIALTYLAFTALSISIIVASVAIIIYFIVTFVQYKKFLKNRKED